MSKASAAFSAPTSSNYLTASGKIPYNMTNDYMFRAVLQENEEALRGLICAVLRMKHSEVRSVRILNPVRLGEKIDDKDFQLDIRVYMNGNTFIDIEMQVENYNNWPMRSLSYLCREFNNLQKGEDYENVRPVFHIGFLDFTLFEDHPEFFATYQMRNARDNHLYSDRFNLLVVSLKEIDIATKEDKKYNLDRWARFFKAKSWEELRMIAQDNKSMEAAAESVYRSNADDNIYWQCVYREDFLNHQKHQKKEMQKLKRELKKKESVIAEKDSALAEKDSTIAMKDSEIAELRAKLEAAGLQ